MGRPSDGLEFLPSGGESLNFRFQGGGFRLGSKVGDLARDVRTTVQTRLAGLNATMQETLSVSGVLLTKTSGRGGLNKRLNDRFEHAALTLVKIVRSHVASCLVPEI